MSALYNLEPQPTAKVLLQTTSGEILLELFAKQTPLTSRNFLQLCLNDYYNGTIFHRLVPGFIIQGGDPTATGEGGDAIYDGGLFADEFHSRLKFNRRGLLGMANTGRKNDNGSQFFLTLGKTEELNGRNTMFGRVVGDTIYNLMKMGEAELAGEEKSEKPMYPTKITSTEILVNPFEDMVKEKTRNRSKATEETQPDRKKPKKKLGKALLSFENNGEDVEEDLPVKKTKFNTKLVTAFEASNGRESVIKDRSSIPKTLGKITPGNKAKSPSPHPKPQPDPKSQLPLPNNEEPSRKSSNSPEIPGVDTMSSLLDRTNAQIAELKASMKRNLRIIPSEPLRKKSALEQMIPDTSIRGRKRKHNSTHDSMRDAQSLKILAAFREKLEKAPPETVLPGAPEKDSDNGISLSHQDDVGHGTADKDEEAHLCDLHFIANCQSCKSWDQHLNDNAEAEAEDDNGWMSHALSFEKDRLGKDLTWKKKMKEELVVIDPREKAKDIEEEHRAMKVSRGGGLSSKAWDRDRDRGRAPDITMKERRQVEMIRSKVPRKPF